MSEEKDKIIIVAGPTSVGKTNYAITIAQKLNGELISADSRQIYRYLNIGTNKGEVTIQNNINLIQDIPIHLINLINPDENFNLYDYSKLARSVIQDILDRNRLPIIVGGTGLYIDSIIKAYNLNSSINNKYSREDLNQKSLNELTQILKSENSTTYENLNNSDKHNPRRLIRLIEKSIESETISSSKVADYDSIMFYPNYNWDELKVRIENRVDEMIKDGLIKEVKLILKNYPETSTGLQTMGYKEIVQFLNNKVTLNQAIKLIKIAHRQYARRQRTWFESPGRNYSLINIDNTDQLIQFTREFLKDGKIV